VHVPQNQTIYKYKSRTTLIPGANALSEIVPDTFFLLDLPGFPEHV